MMILRSSKVGREPEETVEPIKMLQVSVNCLLRFSLWSRARSVSFHKPLVYQLVSVCRFEVVSDPFYI